MMAKTGPIPGCVVLGVHSRRICLSCKAADMRARRARGQYPWIYDQKGKARAILNVYVRRGTIHKRPCEICGTETVQAHHEDYAKPLVVRWLCRRHHNMIHADTLCLLPAS